MSNCLVCHKELAKKQKKFCSKGCQHKSFEGEGNPMYRNGSSSASCLVCKKEFTYYEYSSSGKYCSQSCSHKCPIRRKAISDKNRGRIPSQKQRDALSKRMKGVPKTREHISKVVATRLANLEKYGRKTDGVVAIRISNEYADWRKAVFERDKYACTECGDSRGGNLEADHIISLSVLVEESKNGDNPNYYDIDNGRTLCTPCHKNTQSYAKHWRYHTEGILLHTITKAGGDYQKTMSAINDQLKAELSRLTD